MKEMHTETREGRSRLTVFTIGHSTRPVCEFVRLLQSNGVEQIIDIRAILKSRSTRNSTVKNWRCRCEPTECNTF
jgi:hypothetical protein